MHYPTDTVQSRCPSPLGEARLAASSLGLVGLWFDGQRHLPAQLDGPGAWPATDAHPVLREAARQLQEYLGGTRTCFDLSLDLRGGTPFQQAVWRALCAIPRGRTTSYLAIAQALGKPSSVRAVGAAVGRNPVSVAVPCHRVLGSDGSLTGYAGGLERKRALLRLEEAAPPPLSTDS
ncbi:methylated-DNA-[protein]-cysteine S-methyltransferase [Paenacidovorax caeni]|uniref:Methylated-DNA--protein-cysteine methyltransferase n=1 Tax=Paenacidovorax caeni TaxID=343013 RepID=A0A1I7JW07_9BURK|nr:methylated-DNA--[protein]-cysteine S-methyltransferase [Paenacidovorax caeni]SFU89315.1 methylated-DNA-[protein]-cysteine S-methyltransferase [Paenacidovorax caeni]